MSSLSDYRRKQYGGLNNGKLYGKSDVFEPSANQTEYIEAKQRAALVEWINGILPGLDLPAKASPEELRACLIDGTVLLQILNKLRPGSVNEGGGSHLENVGKFLAVMDQLEIPRFELSDLQRGSMKTVLDCLLAVRARFMNFGDSSSTSSTVTRGGNSDAASHGFISPTAEIRRPSVALTHNLGPKFHEVFQLKQGRYAELSAAKISEMMKSNSLDNAPTQSLLSVVNGILDEGIERKNGEIPHRVACLLRKVVLEIERRISTQADHLRTQNNLFKAREEKYQSRIRVLEALAGTGEETGIFADQLQQVKNERSKLEDRKSGEVVITLMKEKEQRDIELSALRQELEISKRINGDVMRLSKEKEQRDLELSALRQELAIVKRRDEDVIKLIAEKEQRVLEVSALRQELEIAKKRDEDVIKLIAEKEQRVLEVSALRQELEIARRRDEDVITLTKEKEERDLQLSALRQELEKAKSRDEDALTSMKKEEQRDVELSSLRQELEVAKRRDEDLFKLIKEKEQRDLELSLLRQELEVAKRRDKDVFELMKEKEQRDLEQSLLRQELEVAKRREEDASNLMREKEQRDLELSSPRQELEMAKRELSSLRQELEMANRRDEDVLRLMKEKEQRDLELSSLRQELEMAKRRDEDFLRLIKEKEQRDLDLSSLRQELEMAKRRDLDALRLMKEKEQRDLELSSLRQELEVAKRRDEDALRLMKDKEQRDLELSLLRQELEMAKRRDEDALRLMKEKEQRDLEISSLRQELGVAKRRDEDVLRLIKEKEQRDLELSALRQELETEKQTHELHCLQMESEANGVRVKLEQMLQKLEIDLEDSRIKVNVLEANTESKRKTWNKKVQILDNFLDFNVNVMKEFSSSSKSIKHEILKAEKSHSQDLNSLGFKLKLLIHATENYHLVLAENRKMYNELQDLKGNIRVYCRVRPFLPGQAGKKTIVEHIGDNGELVVTNPSKQGKDGRRMFRFNKVYSQDSTQAEVFADTQPLIRSVLDGYNVCIFAYGQTGSGKTYTMTGPNGAPPEEWGVNYRALNDLFCISQNRSGSFVYEVGVQMVEIYNEQVRDLMSSASSQKRLGIVSASQSNGLAVPDATMLPVTSTTDVIDLMDVGLKNRAVGATSMNERSSRSHSVVSIHVEGKDLHDGASLHGNLHLVDLAGSERVDRSEVTGDRLKEAQHINKSLSALGDVIFALARKSTHVPYRNSKLTQLLQTSLGGQAKTLMFVQLNPDTDSYSESLSTLKFAERVSGVELGAARSSKEGRDVRELMEQVASLKDTIAKRDDEIEQLQLLEDLKNVNLGATSEKLGTGSLRSGHSASYESPDSTPRHSLKPSGGRGSSISEKVNSDYDKNLEYSGRHSEAGSRGELEHDNNPGDSEILEYGDGDSEDRLSDSSDVDDLSVGTESNATGEQGSKLSDKLRKHGKVASKIRSLQRATGQTTSTTVSVSRDSIRASTSVKKTNAPGNSTMVKPARKWN